MSANLRREILKVSVGVNNIEVIFKNGSSIKAVPATESARGIRSSVAVIDEFRLVDKGVLDSIIIPTMIIRQTPYTKLPQYAHLQEEPRQIYLSSAYFQSHWMWKHIKEAMIGMYSGSSMLFATDYATTLKHGIKSFEQMKMAKKTSDAMTFDMEYNNFMLGGAENQFYSYELISKAMQIPRAWYPKTLDEYFEGKRTRFGDIKKLDDEIRVVSMDVAISKSTKKTKNDYSVIKCIRCIRHGERYERQEVYIDNFEGTDTLSQAIRLRQIFEDFSADYLVLDARTYGTSIIDELGKVIYDRERDKEYVPIKCFNNNDLAERCKNPSAIPCIYAFIATADKNHEMHQSFKSALIDNKYKMLISHIKCEEEYLRGKKEFDLGSPTDKARYKMPYMYADMTMNEMINLNTEYVQGAKIKLTEPSTGTKDKYVTSAMANLFIQELERDLTAQNSTYDEFECVVLW